MKNIITALLLVLLFVTCSDDNVTIVKQPGELTGTVLPLDINAKVHLTQGDNEYLTSVEADGNFIINDIAPGVYTFQAKANNYGSVKKENIKIEDDEGYEVGTIELDSIPYPLSSISFQGYATYNRYMRLDFIKSMDISSLEKSITISPEVSNIELKSSTTYNNIFNYYDIYGDFDTKIEYTITIDTSAKTFWGEKLEFPYSVKINNFKKFKISIIDTSKIVDSKTSIRIYFNQNVKTNIEEFIKIEPNIALDIDVYDSYLYIRPVNSWIPDTTFILTISKNLEASNGDILGDDTIIKLKTSSLKILASYPQNGQIFLETPHYFNFYPNFLIDSESFINEDCITIEPNVNFTKSIYNSNYYNSEIEVFPTTLQSNTEYTITINTKLKDYWGNNLKEPFTVTFKMN